MTRVDDISNGNSTLTGLPPWARFLAMIGIPGAIAFYLVYIGSQTLPALSRDMVVVRQEEESAQRVYAEMLKEEQEVYRMMQRICANTAKSDTERARCFD